MKWRELKDFCNALTENQLSKDVVLLREESSIDNISAEVLNEDYYWNGVFGEGCFPESEIGGLSEKLIEVYSKGDAILSEEI